MDILTLETEASKLRIKLIGTVSSRQKLFQIYNFFGRLLTENDKNATESYVLEFSEQYYSLIESADSEGINPDFLLKVLEQSQRILELYPVTENRQRFESSINTLKGNYHKILAVLDGKTHLQSSPFLCMPLLVKNSDNEKYDYGVIGSLSVQLKSNKTENKFHIIPSGPETDSSLKKQVGLALINALRIAGRYTEIRNRYWDVYIDFENKSGEYSGSSFGMLLVLKLVEEILRFYDSPTKIFNSSSAALTGAVDENGDIPSLSGNIIRQKIRIIFYSKLNLFILPEDDFADAKDELKKLHTIHPKRSLKLISIPVIDDLFNLRNVVEIKKESRILRTGKFLKRQAVSVISIILLLAVILLSGILDFDNNPARLEQKGHYLHILNKNEKILWKKFMYYDESRGTKGIIRISARVFDIDSNGKNEVIIANEADTSKANYGNNLSRIACYNSTGEIIWTYYFDDTISTRMKKFPVYYVPSLIGIQNEKGKDVLYCFAHQYQYYPGVIFKVDIKNGKKTGDSFWHPGRIADALLGDFNGDGKTEIVAAGAHNGFECNFIFSLNTENISGTGPSTRDYSFYNREITDFNKYILIPLTDMAKFYDLRYGNIIEGSIDFMKSANSFRIAVIEGINSNSAGAMVFVFNNTLDLKDIDCDDAMQVLRDSLVVHGELNGPLTNTQEYFNSLRSRFRYWNGNKFVPSDNYSSNQVGSGE